MAVGFSGSNGGIDVKSSKFNKPDFVSGPLELSYFVNNFCNLNCRHCYVGYKETKNDLSIDEWENVFNEALDLGTLTFGNVGKEPILAWDKSFHLLNFLKEKNNPKIRYGLVTNATLFNDKIIDQLIDANPTYLDISLDGPKDIHDYIRGSGNHNKTVSSIEKIINKAPNFSDKLFISFTLMGKNNNISLFKNMVEELQKKGVKRFMISPYVTSINQKGNNIGITNEQVIDTYRQLKYEANSWLGSQDQLLLKIDYDTQKPLMDKLVENKIIELDNLMIDNYATIFNKFGNLYIGYIPVLRTLIRDIRISHDGYVSNCYAQFFENYPNRKEVIGNVRKKSLKDILERKF